MLVVTTDSIDGKQVREYLGIVAGEAIIGAHVFKDIFAGIRDFVGGRSGGYEDTLREAKDVALAEMQERAQALGADAILAVDLDYEVLGGQGSNMLMVSANGAAVKF